MTRTPCRTEVWSDPDPGTNELEELATGRQPPLCPHPATVQSAMIVLVEGPPDLAAARSRGLPAVAVSHDSAWGPRCAQLLAGRFVTVLMSADPAGRAAAQRMAEDLDNVAAAVAVADFAPNREDGYELNEWLADHPDLSDVALRHLLAPTPDALTAGPPRT
jgi:hypothetical protein